MYSRWYQKNKEEQRIKNKAWRASEAGRASQFARVCRRKGITVAEWLSFWEACDGACPGCRRPLEKGQLTHVDHCHATGTVRGLLCSECNHAVGKTKDDPETLRRLAAYLERAL
jgi:hypothetical protein